MYNVFFATISVKMMKERLFKLKCECKSFREIHILMRREESGDHHKVRRKACEEFVYCADNDEYGNKMTLLIIKQF